MTRFKALNDFKLIMFILALFVVRHAFADVNTSQAKAGVSTYKNTKPQKSDSEFKLSLALDAKAISYAEASTVDSQIQQQLQVGLNLQKTGTFFSESNLVLGTFSETNSAYYAFPQAYLGYKLSTDSHILFGRKKENLSFADSFFNLGLIQSHMTSDNINFIEGGLTGLSTELSMGSFGISAAYLPLFIPNQGPQVKAENGQLITSNRWAPQAPSKFKFGNEYKNINYAIRDYSIADIVSNSGFMLRTYFGQNSTRPLLSATYAKKPINEIALSRDTFSDISNLEGYVMLTPVVLTHTVQALDINLDYENLKTSISYLADQPENKNATELETIQTLNPINVISLYTALDLSYNYKRKFEIYAGMAVISGGEIKDLNSAKQESSIAVATSRTQFVKPIRVGLISELFYVYNQPVESDLKFTYDQKLKGSLLSMKLKYSATKNLKINAGADIIGVENELPENEQGNFLDQNKANDRLYTGIDYVF